MGDRANAVVDTWGRRPVPAGLARRWVEAGWWTDATLGAMVADGLRAMADASFRVWSAERPWRGTMADVDGAARALAAALRAEGVGPGSVVVCQLPNWVEAGITFWAAAYLGAVVVPVVHFYGPKEVGYILRVTAPDVVVTAAAVAGADHLAAHAELLADHPGARWLVVGEDDPARLPAGARPFGALLDAAPLAGPLAADPDGPALIGFTSGTTRDPKGVVHSHRTIGFESRQLSACVPAVGPPPVTGAPVGHFIGMLNAFLMPLLQQRPINLLDRWDPTTVLRLMAEEGLGVTGGATYFLTSLLDHPDFRPEHVARMPFAGLGGSPVPEAVTRRATALGIVAFRSYGSTEHPSITGSTVDDPVDKRCATDGRPLAGVEVRLTDDGEIESRGPDCCIGYTDPGLTAAVFDADGWYRTGDVGVLDGDGYLTITDRISDVIIRGGENVSARELEELLAGMDGVAEVCVVAEPDDRLGERAAAVVRARPGEATPGLADVRAHLQAAGLARQKWPECLHLVDDFPRTASGKVQKFRLRQQLRDAPHPAGEMRAPTR